MNYNVTELGTYGNNNKMYLSDIHKHKLIKIIVSTGDLITSNVLGAVETKKLLVTGAIYHHHHHTD
jgi:hypothetical protein